LDLALYGGQDLGGWRKWCIGRHTARCESCAAAASRYASDSRAIATAARRMPPAFDWNRVAGEMRANIRVAIAAGECVAWPRPAARLPWRAALMATSVAALILTGWWVLLPQSLHRSAQSRATVNQSGVVLETTGFSIERRAEGATLALSHPSDERTVLTVNTDGVLRARYVDDDSGQVTINNVYAQ